MVELVKLGFFFVVGQAAGLAHQEARPAGFPLGALIAILVTIGVLIIGLHVFIAIWMAIDAKKKGRSAAGWAIFGAIPIIGLIGLFIYALLPSGRVCPIHNVPIPPGADRCPVCDIEQQTRMREQEHAQQIQKLNEQIKELSQSGPVIPQPAVSPPTDGSETISITPQVRSLVELMQVGGDHHGRSTVLKTRADDGTPRRALIGRDATCDVTIPNDPTVSRQHCCIGEKDDKFFVADLVSENGTFLKRGEETINVAERGQVELQDGDHLIVGRTRFRVVITRVSEDMVTEIVWNR